MSRLTESQIAASVVKFARANGQRGVRGLVAQRCTGTPGLSGVWQCYVPAAGGGLTSRGPNIWTSGDGEFEKR